MVSVPRNAACPAGEGRLGSSQKARHCVRIIAILLAVLISVAFACGTEGHQAQKSATTAGANVGPIQFLSMNRLEDPTRLDVWHDQAETCDLNLIVTENDGAKLRHHDRRRESRPDTFVECDFTAADYQTLQLRQPEAGRPSFRP